MAEICYLPIWTDERNTETGAGREGKENGEAEMIEAVIDF